MNKEQNEKYIIVIMAGGLGSRMKSSIPKVIHKINNKPMLANIIEKVILLQPEKILIVVGKYKKMIQKALHPYINIKNTKIEWVNQPVANGTGDAVKCCIPYFKKFPTHKVLILSGDVPLIQSSMIKNILHKVDKARVVVTKTNNPKGLGRIIIDNSTNRFIKIKEDKDCTEIEKKINIVNTGVYVFRSYLLLKYLKYINNTNAQQEYYITDMIEILIKHETNIKIDTYRVPDKDTYQFMGINTQEQLEKARVFNNCSYFE